MRTPVHGRHQRQSTTPQTTASPGGDGGGRKESAFVLLQCDERILCVRNRKGAWGLPGGKRDFDDDKTLYEVSVDNGREPVPFR